MSRSSLWAGTVERNSVKGVSFPVRPFFFGGGGGGGKKARETTKRTRIFPTEDKGKRSKKQ